MTQKEYIRRVEKEDPSNGGAFWWAWAPWSVWNKHRLAILEAIDGFCGNQSEIQSFIASNIEEITGEP